MKIGHIIKRLRTLRGYNQAKFAYKCRISQSYLSLIESDNKIPSLQMLELISKVLNISAPFLIFYSIDENDIPEAKKDMYKILEPHMKKMVDEIVFGNISH